MASEVHELAVKLTPKGAEETTDALEETSETFEETAQTAEVESARLDDFSDKWKGAMSAILAGLTLAAAGLASKVPVIQENMSALDAVLGAIGRRIDEKVRPRMSKLNIELFELADAIERNEGEWGEFLDVLEAFTRVAPLFIAIRFGLDKAKEAWNGFKNWFNGKVSDMQSAWDSFTGHIEHKFALARASIIDDINQLIRSYNALPFTDNVPTIGGNRGQTGRTPGRTRTGDSAPTGGGRGPAGNPNVPGQRSPNTDVQRQLQRSLELIANSRARFEVNLDGRKIAETTRPLLGENTLDRGRSG